MGVFSGKYRSEGYYTEDEYGEIVEIFDRNELIDALENDRLFYCDGFTTTLVRSLQKPNKNKFEDEL